MISKELKKKVLSVIKPNKKEHQIILHDVEELISQLNKSAKALSIKASFLVGGSFGKGTYLKDSFDVDIFCRFDLSYQDLELSGLAKSILDEIGLIYFKQKGSRDYFSGNFKSIHFELVPNYFITSLTDAKNSTDYSPMHVEFVLMSAKKNPHLLDEIRLTKQFLKAKGLYGAESYINGFSGHIIDLLIIFYGTLDTFLEHTKTWGDQTLVDVANNYSSNKTLLDSMDDTKISNLIVVDPILKERNAARALGVQKYFELIYLTQSTSFFSEEDFIINLESSEDFLKRTLTFANSQNVYRISYELSLTEIESEDIAGSKLLKLFSKIVSYYTKKDFTLFEKDFFISFEEKKCIFIYYFEKHELSTFKLIVGPQIYRHDAVVDFSKNKNDFFVKDDRICTYEKREVTLLQNYDSLDILKLKKLFSKNLDFIVKVIFKFL